MVVGHPAYSPDVGVDYENTKGMGWFVFFFFNSIFIFFVFWYVLSSRPDPQMSLELSWMLAVIAAVQCALHSEQNLSAVVQYSTINTRWLPPSGKSPKHQIVQELGHSEEYILLEFDDNY